MENNRPNLFDKRGRLTTSQLRGQQIALIRRFGGEGDVEGYKSYCAANGLEAIPDELMLRVLQDHSLSFSFKIAVAQGKFPKIGKENA